MSILELSWPSHVPRLLFRVCPLCRSIEFSQPSQVLSTVCYAVLH